MSTKKYLIKLIPHEKFFFGGERNFNRTGGEDVANYMVKSNYFPQQTALLGFVRHQLLLQSDDAIFKDNKIVDEKLAADLIGENSFAINREFPYGAIHSISPIFISNTENEHHVPANKEYQFDTKINDDCSIEIIDHFLEYENSGIPILDKYNPKYNFPDVLQHKNNNPIEYNEIFQEHRQIGIRKNYEGNSEDGDKGLYIQIFYKFKASYCFAFVVEFDEKTELKSSDLVSFGGEQQSFNMEISEFKDNLESIFPDFEPSKNIDKLVLISDAYVENNEVLAQCEFANTETVDMRFIESKTQINTNYYTKPALSVKYNLFKKGSVFYGDTAKIASYFKNEIFKNLGYNHYKIINKKQSL